MCKKINAKFWWTVTQGKGVSLRGLFRLFKVHNLFIACWVRRRFLRGEGVGLVPRPCVGHRNYAGHLNKRAKKPSAATNWYKSGELVTVNVDNLNRWRYSARSTFDPRRPSDGCLQKYAVGSRSAKNVPTLRCLRIRRDLDAHRPTDTIKIILPAVITIKNFGLGAHRSAVREFRRVAGRRGVFRRGRDRLWERRLFVCLRVCVKAGDTSISTSLWERSIDLTIQKWRRFCRLRGKKFENFERTLAFLARSQNSSKNASNI